ncbi:bifunctional DNA primase/polymerase [Bifidobacterium biavatii]|uniref:Phage primase n=1 Tax=Bifidobacterium biavatii DSM 23969 TaxID=1437608 RepID=A0A086ZYW7_9BIFI|nr:bifunctional DNA primase/polymerase [Bifidobacterium biavatii]KFI51717.1 phage primase [Bifidobacterium biavatii DSM 23969]
MSFDARYKDYEPIETDTLPAKFFGCFKLLDLTFAPANDYTIIRTIDGHSLELVCDGDDDGKRKKQPVVDAGYQKAIWELREHHLRYCPSQDRLWRRDVDDEDHPGPRRILNSWHPVKSIEDEYGIGSRSNDGRRNPNMSAAIFREAKRSRWFPQVERGLRCDPCVWIRQSGKIVELRNENDIAVTQTLDPRGMGNAVVDQAWQIARWLTVDEHSARNLIRLFATPWLEAFKQLTFVLSGHGGDGKTLIMRQAVMGVLGSERVFPGFSVAQYCASGGYTLNRESMNDAMDGKAFAYDDEACEVSEPMLPSLRALSTGSEMQARVTGGKYRTVTPTATMVILTNMAFADSTENSDRRRFVKIEMHQAAGRSYDEYHAIELFCKKHPAAFYVASARLWAESEEPDMVNLSPARQISDEMYWLITEIQDNESQYGQPIASRNGYRDQFHTSIPASLLDLLGLKNSTTTVFPGGQQRVVRVADQARFDVYANALASDVDEPDETQSLAVQAAAMPGVDSLQPIEIGGDTCRDNAQLVESLCGGQVGFAPCEGREKKAGEFDEKVSLSWKRLNRDMEHRSSADTVRLDQTRYCVPLLGRMFVIDCDDAKQSGEPHGFQVLQAQVGEYGSPALPSTLAVRSPHGMHLYYQLPANVDIGRLKNAVHPDGLPIDLRVSGKGYVLGPGSVANGGRYQLVDVPDDGEHVPEATPQLLQFLEREYMDSTQLPASAATGNRVLPGLDEIMRAPASVPVGRRSGGRPDMSPVPEGARNDTLHSWAYGRLLHHPDNERQIERDLYERGHASGLQDAELATIWKSIKRHQGKA